MIKLVQKIAKELDLDPRRLAVLIKQAPYMYRDTRIEKSSGKFRFISIPNSQLKIAQERILKKYFYQIQLPRYIQGGVPGKSIKTNAEQHINKQFVVNLDIKNFFPSIRLKMLERGLGKSGFDQDIIKIILRLTTHNHCLPQGAPTSPFISNLVLIDCDRALQQFCKSNHLIYTRYFDDITFSGKHANKFLKRITDIIIQNGFLINNAKTKIQGRNQDQKVTGLIVNKYLKIPQEDFEEINGIIDLLEKNGIGIFKADSLIKDSAILRGKIAFLQQVNPRIGGKLNERFKQILSAQPLLENFL